MSITEIDLSDPRTVKAIDVLAGYGQWARVRFNDGRKAFGVPSQSAPGLFHFTTATSCSCEDAKRNSACKHRRAVVLFLAHEAAVRRIVSRVDDNSGSA